MTADEQRRATRTGIGYMVVSMAIVAVQDATVKWLAGGYPVGEVIFFRAVFTMLPIAFFVWRAGGRPALRTRRPGAHGLRAGLMVCSMFLFVLALSLMPLADAVTLTFTGPMFVTALAPVLLGERVGWRRWLAVAVGFAGVVVVLRPGTGTLQLVVIVPVLAALASALRDVVTRRMGSGESLAAIMFYTTLAQLGASALTLPMGWAWVTVPDLGLFLVAGRARRRRRVLADQGHPPRRDLGDLAIPLYLGAVGDARRLPGLGRRARCIRHRGRGPRHPERPLHPAPRDGQPGGAVGDRLTVARLWASRSGFMIGLRRPRDHNDTDAMSAPNESEPPILRNSRSAEIYDRARTVLPGGTGRNASTVAPFPIYMAEGRGAYTASMSMVSNGSTSTTTTRP